MFMVIMKYKLRVEYRTSLQTTTNNRHNNRAVYARIAGAKDWHFMGFVRKNNRTRKCTKWNYINNATSALCYTGSVDTWKEAAQVLVVKFAPDLLRTETTVTANVLSALQDCRQAFQELHRRTYQNFPASCDAAAVSVDCAIDDILNGV